MTMTLVVMGRDFADAASFDLSYVDADELIFVATFDARFGGQGALGNHYLTSALGDVVGIVHADVFLGIGACAALVRVASAGAVVGVVGKTLDGKVPHADEIEEPMAVSTLDSCSVFFPRDIGVRFDAETFDSFHCCVEDFCLQAARSGRTILVPPANARHLARNVDRSDRQAWLDGHTRYWHLLRKKWVGTPFNTC